MLPELISQATWPVVVRTTGVALLLWVVASYATSWYRLRHFPGPTLASLSYISMFRISVSGRQGKFYKDVNKRYGAALVRIGPNDLITDDPHMVRRMNAARSPYLRSAWYSPAKFHPYDDTMFSMTDSAAHDRLKARLSFGYSGRDNAELEVGMEEQLAALVDLIRRKYVSTDGAFRPLDFAATSLYWTLDVISRISYGKAFGFLAAESDVNGFIQAAEGKLPVTIPAMEIPLIGRIAMSPLVLGLLGPKKTDKTGVGPVLKLAEEVVSRRFGPNSEDRSDMLGSFIRHGVTQKQCETEVPFQLIAGAETSATVIRGTMLFLMSTRHAYDRLQREIDAAVAEGRVSSPVRADEGRQLEYLQAVIHEGMRMQIGFSGLTMKQVPPGGDTVDGLFIPGGTRIAHNMIGLQRRTEVFGEDVEVFRPERWLGLDQDRRKQMVDTVELTFGYGRWGCSGKPIAYMELNKIFVELLRYFDFQVVNPKQPWVEANYNVFFHHEMWLRVTERNVHKESG